MAVHASVTTTARYDRRDDAVQRKAPAAQRHVPYWCQRTESRSLFDER